MLTAVDYMNRALFLAARGTGRTMPNPVVGAVIVAADGTVVGWGHHERAGEAHAEIHALRMAGDRAKGSTLYCTLEPCCHWGRTGPCVERIVESGVAHVVAATEDPDPRVGGKGFEFLRAHGITVDVGVGAAQAITLNRAYFTRVREGRPFVVLKAAMSVDGYIAEAPGVRTTLTSDEAARHAHAFRAEIDAVGVGAGTILADDPLLTPRAVYRARPLIRVIFDRRLRTPASARVLSTLEAGPVIIVTSAEAAGSDAARILADRGASIEAAEGATFREALATLAPRQVGSLLLEGGSTIHEAAWIEGVVDFVRVYVAPRTLGGGIRLLNGLPFASGLLFERRVEQLGPDVLIEGYVHRPH